MTVQVRYPTTVLLPEPCRDTRIVLCLISVFIIMDIQPLKQDAISRALRTPASQLPRHKPGEEFLKGPIPLHWLREAALLPGKALAICLAIWFKAGATKKRTVHLTSKLLDKFGVGRKAGYRGLKKLESAGLISVYRHAGRCPRVTILDANQYRNTLIKPQPGNTKEQGKLVSKGQEM